MKRWRSAQFQLLTLAITLALASAVLAQGLAGRKLTGRQARKQTLAQPVRSETPAAPPKTEAKTEPKNQFTPSQQLKALFTDQERSLAFLGSGNPVAQMLVLRELNRLFPLSPHQRVALHALAREAQPQLLALRNKRAQQERALEEAIYGENFDPKVAEQLASEAAATQKELLTRQVNVESQVVRILAQENRGQARYFLMLVELVVGPKRNQVPLPMLLTGQYNGQWRLLQDSFGEDMDLLIPSFSSPLAVLLVMRQLELTPAQKTEFKALAKEVRTALLDEREAANANGRDLPGRAENATPLERMTERLENRDRFAAENAERQARAMKLQVHIETRIRQLLTAKQWDDYTTLLRALLANNLGRPALPVQLPNGNRLRQQGPPFKNPLNNPLDNSPHDWQ